MQAISFVPRSVAACAVRVETTISGLVRVATVRVGAIGSCLVGIATVGTELVAALNIAVYLLHFWRLIATIAIGIGTNCTSITNVSFVSLAESIVASIAKLLTQSTSLVLLEAEGGIVTSISNTVLRVDTVMAESMSVFTASTETRAGSEVGPTGIHGVPIDALSHALEIVGEATIKSMISVEGLPKATVSGRAKITIVNFDGAFSKASKSTLENFFGSEAENAGNNLVILCLARLIVILATKAAKVEVKGTRNANKGQYREVFHVVVEILELDFTEINFKMSGLSDFFYTWGPTDEVKHHLKFN